MRKFTKAIAALMLTVAVVFTACTKDPNSNNDNVGDANTPEGAIGGIYSVSASTQVYFSQGNLQYQASTNTWRFAENQYDYLGDDNDFISPDNDGWIDLFGWGTSGWNCGNTYYRPWDFNINDGSLFGPPGCYNLTDSYANCDWGRYNAISNGGNQAGLWRTLTTDEWVFLLNTRYTPSGIRYAKAQVNGMNGVILVPDDWNVTTFSLNNTNDGFAGFTSNVVDSMVWQDTFEPAGAVFLPAAGCRYGTSVPSTGSLAFYWSASHSGSSYACYVHFCDSYLNSSSYNSRHPGRSVRLVCPAEN